MVCLFVRRLYGAACTRKAAIPRLAIFLGKGLASEIVVHKAFQIHGIEPIIQFYFGIWISNAAEEYECVAPCLHSNVQDKLGSACVINYQKNYQTKPSKSHYVCFQLHETLVAILRRRQTW